MIALQSHLVHSGSKLKTPGEEDRGMLVVKTVRRETEHRGMLGGHREVEYKEEEKEEEDREKRG